MPNSYEKGPHLGNNDILNLAATKMPSHMTKKLTSENVPQSFEMKFGHDHLNDI